MEAGEADLMRKRCRAAGIWRVSEVRRLDGVEMGEAAQSEGALERPVDNGKAGTRWGEVVRRVARARGGDTDVMGTVLFICQQLDGKCQIFFRLRRAAPSGTIS